MLLLYGKSCVLNLLAFFAFTTAAVVVRDNGYQNILVTFSPDVEKDDQQEILLATKELIKLTSSIVQKATGIHFGEVIFLLPYTWGTLEAWSKNNLSDVWSNDEMTYSSADEVYYEANIFVENSADTVYGAKPITLQTAGCGSEGLRISVPKDFIIDKNSADGSTKAKLLAREWIRYRYGVFYENGYPNDDRYPLYFAPPGSDNPTDIRITDCTNKPVEYSFRDTYGKTCLLETDKSTGLPGKKLTTCSFRPDEENNTDVVSSLMYVKDLPNVAFLCNDTNHKAEVPNKQNMLCKARSIWSVMNDHPDFSGGKVPNPTSSPPDPTFKLAFDANPRIVLVVDRSNSITGFTEKMTKSIIQKFLLDLPDETEFGLFRFNPTPIETIPFGFLVNRSMDAFAFVGNNQASPNTAVMKALEVLTEDSRGKKGTIVVLSSSSSTADKVDIAKKEQHSGICLSLVILDRTSASSEGFQELLDAFECSHLLIIPPAVNKNDALSNLMQMNEEFARVIGWHTYHNAKRTVGSQIANALPISFETERSVKQFQMWLTNADASLKDAFEDYGAVLTKGTGGDIQLHRIESKNNFVVYDISDIKGDKFTLTINEFKDDTLPMLLQIVIRESNAESIRVRTWIKDSTDNSGNSEQMPVALYTEVTMGINPILDAQVKALVSKPDNSTYELDLLDNGLDDPDVTKNDGIYTRYFTQFSSEGDYNVVITISDNDGLSQTAEPPNSDPTIPCCGSFVPTGIKHSTGPFKRVLYTKFRAVSGRPSGGYKPGAVRDLRLARTDDSGNVSVTFTSPGNEMDQGAAGKYIFKLFRTREDAEKTFERENEFTNEIKIPELLVPKEYPNEETVEIELSENIPINWTYYFAMRSESRSGKQSDTSNIVQLFIPPIVSTTASPTRDDSNGDGDLDGKGTSVSNTASSGKIAGIVIGVCLFVILICIGVYIAFYFLFVRPKRRREEEKSVTPPPEKRKDSDEDTGDGTLPAEGWKMDGNSISPINSWPSDVLVTHHEKVKEARRKNERPPIFRVENMENSPDVICTISNGLLPNPVYSSHADDLNENDYQDPMPQQTHLQEDRVTSRPSRKVSHV